MAYDPSFAPQTPEEFEVFLAFHYDRMFRIAIGMLGAVEDAEDVVQDLCLALPQKLRGFRGEAKVTTWLHKVVTNAVLDRIRASARRARTDGWADWIKAQSHAQAEQRDRLIWLAEALATLDDDLRVTAVLLVEDGMSQADAAEILGVAQGTVAWRMSEIKKRLRALAQEEMA